MSGLRFFNQFMGARPTYAEAKVALFGCPFDGTSSYRPGSRFAPNAIREASWGLETYSPILDRDLEEVAFWDGGDLELPFGAKNAVLDMIYAQTWSILADDKVPLMVGGEHLLTLATVQACHKRYSDLSVIQFDAHGDLRNDYQGEPLSHASVMRRILDFMEPAQVVQVGIRSGPKDEFRYAKEKGLCHTHAQIPHIKARLAHQPVYLTIDLDVLDPSILPGTGTPEPGGWTFRELAEAIYGLRGLNIVGLDVVELAPNYDTSGVSSVVAAKVVRECLLSFF